MSSEILDRSDNNLLFEWNSFEKIYLGPNTLHHCSQSATSYGLIETIELISPNYDNCTPLRRSRPKLLTLIIVAPPPLDHIGKQHTAGPAAPSRVGHKAVHPRSDPEHRFSGTILSWSGTENLKFDHFDGSEAGKMLASGSTLKSSLL